MSGGRLSGELLPDTFLATTVTRAEARDVARVIAGNIWQMSPAHTRSDPRISEEHNAVLTWIWRGRWHSSWLTDAQIAALLRWCLMVQVQLVASFQEPATDAEYVRIAQAHNWLAGLRIALSDRVYARVEQEAYDTGLIAAWERNSEEAERRWLAARLPDGLDFPDRESVACTILDARPQLAALRDEWAFTSPQGEHAGMPDERHGPWNGANTVQTGGVAWV